MRIIAIVSQKGGAGKTTIAINLAGAAEASGLSTVVVDLDPQASAKEWHDLRSHSAAPVVISAQPARLAAVLKDARDAGADLCIIDTAPHSETAALSAAKVADLVLIPCRPSYMDLVAMATSVELVTIARRPAMFVLNAVRPGDKSSPRQAEESLVSLHAIPVAAARVGHRAAFVRSVPEGKTVCELDADSPAAREIRDLFVLTCPHDPMEPGAHGGLSK